MKKLITVKTNDGTQTNLLNADRLDELEEKSCACLLEQVRQHIEAYQRLRRARNEFTEAEKHVVGHRCHAWTGLRACLARCINHTPGGAIAGLCSDAKNPRLRSYFCACS